LLVVDDEPSLRSLLNDWFRHAGYELALAADGQEALALAERERFDVMVTDLKMPGMCGLKLLELIKQRDPDIEVVFLSGQAAIEDAIAALREGRAFDFLQKPLNNIRDLSEVVERALARRRAKRAPAGPPPGEALSARERELMVALAEGLNNKGIADRMALGEKTVKNHLTRIYAKLGVSNRTQAVLACQRLGLL
jgi:DNA-binding NarL/FixJ family response regulator